MQINILDSFYIERQNWGAYGYRRYINMNLLGSEFCSPTVMFNFLCKTDWATGCSDS